ncbi:MAG: response regulator [Anaerolineae bacterium]|nr:response regulator [Anaerolineae bacterium]
MLYDEAATWKVLVVEDDDSNRMVVSHILRFYDAEVFEAASGEEAVVLLDKLTDLTFCLFDIQMPHMSGWQLLKEVRGRPLPAISQVPVIAVTALAMQGDRERILAAGFNGYIMKPVDAGTFIEQIADILATCKETRKV